MLIDGVYKNHKACQMEKIGDIWKHWCLDHLGECHERSGRVWERIQDHGMDLIGIGYKLFTVMMNHDRCASAEQRIKEIADVIEGLSSASVMILGFKDAWDPKELDHLSRKEFRKEKIDEQIYLKEAAEKIMEKKAKEIKDAVAQMVQQVKFE